MQRILICAISAGLVASPNSVVAQDSQSRPMRLVAPETGGGADIAARLIAQGLSVSLGRQVVVDNRPGGGGLIKVQVVLSAPPDGNTLLFSGSDFWTLPLLQTAPYQPLKDFAPITLSDRAPNILAVHPSVAAKSVKELIALAKAKPGQLNYGSSGTGTANHLAGEMFKAMAGVNIVRVAYKGAAPSLNDLVAGQIQMMFAITAAIAPYMKSGRLRALAVTSAEPSALAPELPTVAASGLPGYESETPHGIHAPAKTSPAIVNRLYQDIVRVINQPDMKERLLNAGVETIGNSPQQFAAKIKSEMAKLGKIIKDAGIRAD